jgi:hypothetical protein
MKLIDDKPGLFEVNCPIYKVKNSDLKTKKGEGRR